VGDDKKAWTVATYGEVRATLGFLSPAAAELVVSHLALESGFGGAKAAVHGRNLGNLTAGTWWTGPKWKDEGGDRDARGEPIDQWWRIYPTVSDFLCDYWNFLGPTQNHGRYTVSRNHLERGLLGDFATTLRFAGYYELGCDLYTQRLRVTADVVHLYLSPAVTPGAP
jgi:hypothetical protein